MCRVIRAEQVELRGNTHTVNIYECCPFNESWRAVARAVHDKLGIRLAKREWISGELMRLGVKFNLFDILSLKAACENGCTSGMHDWIDRGLLTDLTPRRCGVCKRIASRPHRECEKKKLEARWSEYEASRSRSDAVIQIRLQQKVVKLVANLSYRMDELFTIKQASNMLPYRPNRGSMFRLCITQKIEARKLSRMWMITGRGILSILKRWIDTGRAPCRTRASTRAMSSLN